MTSATNHNVQRYPNGAARGSQQPFLRCHGRQPSRNGIIWLLFTILLSFFLCHALRFFLAFYFSAVTIDNMNCGKNGYKRETHLWLHYITSINHVALVFNSSTNFIKYCLIGSRFRSVLIELFCSKQSQRKKQVGGHCSSVKGRQIHNAGMCHLIINSKTSKHF